MIRAVQTDTQVASPTTIISALDEAQEWCANRILVMDENILKVSNDQMTMTGDTKTYDLGANISTGTLYQLKWLGVQLSTDTKFHQVEWVVWLTKVCMETEQVKLHCQLNLLLYI